MTATPEGEAMRAGIHQMPRQLYDADPCEAPSLSASVAKILLAKSPRHAWLAHPRLNPNYEPEDRREFDLGSAVHALALGEAHRMVEIPAENYRTKAAQEARDAAIQAGRVPALPHQIAQARAILRALHAQLPFTEEARGAFTGGKAEHVAIWQDGGAWCRARIDWMPSDGNVIYDLKTTGAVANPEQWVRSLYDQGGDVQAAFYLRGMEALTGKPWHFRFVVVETEPPHGLSVIALNGEAEAIARAKADHAVRAWAWCLANRRWPGYPRATAYVQAPAWEVQRHEARLTNEEIARDAGRALIEQMIEWQSPIAEEAA
jgi:hypothetical protein